MSEFGNKSDFVQQNDEAALSGYLYKKTRDDRWQKRWFETNGVYLTYYKSRKMEKLLAALSLPQVGEIKVIPPEEDPEKNGVFSLELNTRIFTLRAKSNAEAELWVTTLNKLRQEGIAASAHQKANDQKVALGRVESGVVAEAKKAQPASNAEWMKSGKSCFGCC